MKWITACVAACCIAGMPVPQAARAQDIKPLVEAYNTSGLDIFHHLAARPSNIVFSPYSIGSAMAMARSGARGATEAEMASVLRNRLPRADADAANGALLRILNAFDKSALAPNCAPGMQWSGHRCEGPPSANGCFGFTVAAQREGELCIAPPLKGPASAKLVAANALMLPGSGQIVSAAYRSLVKDKYAAEVFAGVGLEDINGWVNKKTDGNIPKILDELNPEAKAVLLNAIYFKAYWASTFVKTLTRHDAFNLSAAQQIHVPTMRQTGDYRVVARQGYRAVRLPYEIEPLAMVIALPNEVEGLAEVAERLNADELSALLVALSATPAKLVELTMPRFKMSFDVGLIPVFKQLGMALAFNDQADFSGMTGGTAALKIMEIRHRARIDVMEEGTEAAAATAVVFGPETAHAPGKLPQPEPFHVDRPFLFFIADRTTGAVLFHGRLVDPS